jgi:hypothetical protein
VEGGLDVVSDLGRLGADLPGREASTTIWYLAIRRPRASVFA